MKIKIYNLLLILFVTSLIYAGAEITKVTAHNENDNIRVNWETSSEVNVSKFVIERRTQNSQFMEIASIDPKGPSSYSYLDESAYKVQSGTMFYYHIKIVDKDPSKTPSYTATVSIAHDISGVKRTWGSIKAMFR